MARWGGGKGFRMLAHVGCKGKNKHIKITMSGLNYLEYHVDSGECDDIVLKLKCHANLKPTGL